MSTTYNKIYLEKRSYQKQEMLQIAYDNGFEVSEHLLKDWVEKGLLGEAEREWPSHGVAVLYPGGHGLNLICFLSYLHIDRNYKNLFH